MLSTKSEAEGFLDHESLATICTVDLDGKPHAVPVHFIYADGRVYINTDRGSAKVKNLKATPYATVVVYSQEGAVIVRGAARIENDSIFRVIIDRLIDKYEYELDEDGKDSYGIPVGNNDIRCIIEIEPEKFSYW